MKIKVLLFTLIMCMAGQVLAVDLNGTWYTGCKSGTPSLSNPNRNTFTWGTGEEPTSTTATRGALWSYFQDLTLANNGDTLILEFTLVLNDSGTGANVRLGLFNDGGTRLENNLNGNNADAAFLPARGYWVNWPINGGNAQLLGRTAGATSPLSGTGSTGLLTASGAPALTNGVPYAITFSVERITADEYRVIGTLDGYTISTTTSVIATSTFNHFHLLNTATGIGSMTFTDMKVRYNRQAWNPNPAHEDTGVDLDATLSWNTGLDPDNPGNPNPKITQHKVYMSNGIATDEPNVYLVTTLPVGTTTYDPKADGMPDLSGIVDLHRDATYYWQIDEVLGGETDPGGQPAADPNEITGSLWSFQTVLSEPGIDTQPVDSLVALNAPIILSVVATNPFTGNSDGLTYQWYKNLSIDPGETDPTLSILSAQITDEGVYYCKVTIISNGAFVDSDTALLGIRRQMARWTLDQADYVGGQYLDTSTEDPVAHHADPNSPPTFVEDFDATANGATVISPASWATAGTWNPSEHSDQLTASAWIKWDGEPLDSNGNSIVAKRDSWGPDTMMWSLLIRDITDGKAGIRFYNNSGMSVWPSGVVEANVWTHVCATFDGISGKVYINGELKGTDDTSALGTGTASLLELGSQDFGAAVFPGALDDIQIYNYGKNAEEVAQIYYGYTGISQCLYPPVLDITGPGGEKDCRVDLLDFAEFATEWLECGLVPDCLP